MPTNGVDSKPILSAASYSAGPVLRVDASGSLTYANEQGAAMLHSLGWRRRKPLPDPLRRAIATASASSQAVAFDFACGEDAYSLRAWPGYGGCFVHLSGTRIIAGTALAEAMPHLAWSRDPAGRALYLNRQWRAYTGLSLAQENQRGWEQLHHPKDVARFRRLWAKAIAEGSEFEGEFRYRRGDGVYRWFLARAVPVKDQHGRVLRWVGTATEIHDRKIAEARLRSAQAKVRSYAQQLEQMVAERTAALQQSLSESRAFAHTVAHDLKGPLSAIRNFTQAALEDGDTLSGANAEYLRRVVHTAERMDSFLTNLLQLGRLSHEQLLCQPVDLAALIREIVLERPEFLPPRAYIEIQNPTIPVCGDEISLGQCVTNLLGNAVKFVAPGTGPRVRITAETNGDHVRVVFEDNGIGIARKHQSAIFDPFRRAASGDYEGNGLGLAIVKRAVTRMRGRVGVESQLGKGSRFWLELPKA